MKTLPYTFNPAAKSQNAHEEDVMLLQIENKTTKTMSYDVGL